MNIGLSRLAQLGATLMAGTLILSAGSARAEQKYVVYAYSSGADYGFFLSGEGTYDEIAQEAINRCNQAKKVSDCKEVGGGPAWIAVSEDNNTLWLRNGATKTEAMQKAMASCEKETTSGGCHIRNTGSAWGD